MWLVMCLDASVSLSVLFMVIMSESLDLETSFWCVSTSSQHLGQCRAQFKVTGVKHVIREVNMTAVITHCRCPKTSLQPVYYESNLPAQSTAGCDEFYRDKLLNCAHVTNGN